MGKSSLRQSGGRFAAASYGTPEGVPFRFSAAMDGFGVPFRFSAAMDGFGRDNAVWYGVIGS
jgi:hypothetical protein